MGQMFSPDSPTVRFLTRFSELIALNLLWLICCIPIFTIGPSTTAMYYVIRKLVNREEPAVIKTFFTSFKSNFKHSLLVFLVMLVPLTVALDYLILMMVGVLSESAIFKILCWFAIIFVACAHSYVYPLMAHFENTVFGTVRSAFILPTGNPILAVIATLLNLLPLIAFFVNVVLFYYVSFFWLAIGGAVVAWLNTKMLERQFLRYAPEGFAHKEEDEEEPM